MMQLKKHNFDQIIDRNNTSCSKYDLREALFKRKDVVPMWVADMDIAVPDFIIDRIKKRCEHPIFGYTFRDSQYHNAIVEWYKRRRNWNLKSEWLEFCPGVVTGLTTCVNAYTAVGDKIIIQTPVYHPFYHVIENCGRQIVQNPLIEKDRYYTMDFAHLEKVASEGAKMIILCSPHNPVGRVWTADELKKVAEIAKKYNLIVISDEIHSDLVFEPNKFVSFATLDSDTANRTVTLASSSKTFNLAGLVSGFAIIENAKLLKKYKRQNEIASTGMSNIFGLEALKAAFSEEGEEWLNQLLSYIQNNINILHTELSKNVPHITFQKPEATYLAWLDFRSLKIDHEMLISELVNKAGLGLNSGTIFGSAGNGFMRINLACPAQTVKEAAQRLIQTFRR